MSAPLVYVNAPTVPTGAEVDKRPVTGDGLARVRAVYAARTPAGITGLPAGFMGGLWERLAELHAIECVLCHARYIGTRTRARLARWEPYSTRSQRALDAGPMVCPACVGRVLDDAIEAIRGRLS